MLDTMGLPGKADQIVGSMSGGETNALALAR
ncbi:MAG TPA: peptide ABC transporter ATP-binding protein, partial [Dehalococcoidia bacterium]|nr:peptide ABC transporter ATP-binding protein [Dehalococcoidia bacterium]